MGAEAAEARLSRLVAQGSLDFSAHASVNNAAAPGVLVRTTTPTCLVRVTDIIIYNSDAGATVVTLYDGLQEFKIWIRRQPGTGIPSCRIDLYENGALVTSGTLTAVNSNSGELKTFTWDASSLSNANGSLVECYIFGDAVGGAPGARCTVEIGAVEWNVTYTPPGAKTTQYLAGNDCPVFPYNMDVDSGKLPCPPPYD